MKYVANFGEEIGGENYAPGALITATDETASALEVLRSMGRVTAVADGDPAISATGASDARETAPVVGDDLSDHTKAELLVIAEAEGVDVDSGNTKAEIIEAIRTKRNNA